MLARVSSFDFTRFLAEREHRSFSFHSSRCVAGHQLAKAVHCTPALSSVVVFSLSA